LRLAPSGRGGRDHQDARRRAGEEGGGGAEAPALRRGRRRGGAPRPRRAAAARGRLGAAVFGPDVAALWLADEPSSYALVAAAHPLAAREALSPAARGDLPLLVPGRDVNAALHHPMVAAARAGGVEPRLAPLDDHAP
jgi:hypothetical protein